MKAGFRGNVLAKRRICSATANARQLHKREESLSGMLERGFSRTSHMFFLAIESRWGADFSASQDTHTHTEFVLSLLFLKTSVIKKKLTAIIHRKGRNV